jgi:hypothetical protein
MLVRQRARLLGLFVSPCIAIKSAERADFDGRPRDIDGAAIC